MKGESGGCEMNKALQICLISLQCVWQPVNIDRIYRKTHFPLASLALFICSSQPRDPFASKNLKTHRCGTTTFILITKHCSDGINTGIDDICQTGRTSHIQLSHHHDCLTFNQNTIMCKKVVTGNDRVIVWLSKAASYSPRARSIGNLGKRSLKKNVLNSDHRFSKGFKSSDWECRWKYRGICLDSLCISGLMKKYKVQFTPCCFFLLWSCGSMGAEKIMI